MVKANISISEATAIITAVSTCTKKDGTLRSNARAEYLAIDALTSGLVYTSQSGSKYAAGTKHGTEVVKLLQAAGYDAVEGNDAPRGGMSGDYVAVTHAGDKTDDRRRFINRWRSAQRSRLWNAQRRAESASPEWIREQAAKAVDIIADKPAGMETAFYFEGKAFEPNNRHFIINGQFEKFASCTSDLELAIARQIPATDGRILDEYGLNEISNGKRGRGHAMIRDVWKDHRADGDYLVYRYYAVWSDGSREIYDGTEALTLLFPNIINCWGAKTGDCEGLEVKQVPDPRYYINGYHGCGVYRLAIQGGRIVATLKGGYGQSKPEGVDYSAWVRAIDAHIQESAVVYGAGEWRMVKADGSGCQFFLRDEDAAELLAVKEYNVPAPNGDGNMGYAHHNIQVAY